MFITTQIKCLSNKFKEKMLFAVRNWVVCRPKRFTNVTKYRALKMVLLLKTPTIESSKTVTVGGSNYSADM